MPTIKINNINMHYEITGEGQPLLLLHGLGSSSRDWEKQIPAFAEYFQVITFDARGHGSTDKPRGPYSISMFTEDTAAFMKAIDIGQAHVVGISMGGMIAFQVAVDHPELIRSMTIANATPELLVQTFKDRMVVLQREFIVRLIGMRKMGEVLGARLFPKAEHDDIRNVFVERWAENDSRAYLASMRSLVNWSVMEHIESIEIPTLVIAADQDYTWIGEKETFVAMMQNAELVVIVDSRHATPAEKPEEFNRVVMDFLAKQR
ncbi:MAG: alpha/beta fold hydrolase [Anaerolineales bacterium]|nr:alpha/beta fold hydrolase [Chloroflexota bacterium]MBL6982187.1 alpha/beta fold hydrolase [Anaerolineales bacterium]